VAVIVYLYDDIDRWIRLKTIACCTESGCGVACVPYIADYSTRPQPLLPCSLSRGGLSMVAATAIL